MGDEGLTTAQLDGETTPWLPQIVAVRLAFQTGYVLTLRYEFASQFIALSQFMTNGVRLLYSQVIAKAAPGTWPPIGKSSAGVSSGSHCSHLIHESGHDGVLLAW